VEDRIELGDLQQILDAFGQVQQLQSSTLVGDGGETGDQFADARAIDIGDLAQIQQDLIIAFGDQVAQQIAQRTRPFAESNPAGNVHDCYVTYLPGVQFNAHLHSLLI